MKITYAVTCLSNEDKKIYLKNIRILKNHFKKVNAILNTDNKFSMDGINVINKVGDMKYSRQQLMLEASKTNASMYFIFDSDIKITNNAIKKIKKIDRGKFDFVSLFYKGDPPIPAFFTLSSSLTDFYNMKLSKDVKFKYFFDDTEFNNPKFHIPSRTNKTNKFENILNGKSFARTITNFTNKTHYNDTTTGGASIYFKKELLNYDFKWEKYEGKSLTWYDSYRTYKLKEKGYRFAKVPIFVNHSRHNSIQLSWLAVKRYILGFNKYMAYKCKDWEDEAILLHSFELLNYIKGMIKKITALENLSTSEKETIKKISEFIEEENIFKGERKWK